MKNFKIGFLGLVVCCFVSAITSTIGLTLYEKYRWHTLRIDAFQYEVVDHKYNESSNEIVLKLKNKR